MPLLDPFPTEKVPKIRVGLAGIGEHAQRNILPALAACPAISLGGVWTRNEAVAEKIALTYTTKKFSSYRSLLDDQTLDCIYLAIPNSLHDSFGLEALKAGKHLWCEKPFTTDFNKTLSLLRYAESHNLAVCESFMFPHHPQFIKLEDILNENSLGPIKVLYARFGFPHRKFTDIRYDKNLGGGAFLDAACYPIFASYLLLKDFPTHTDCFIGHDQSPVDLFGSAHLIYKNNTVAHLDWGFGRSYRNEIEIWCEEGQIRLERAFSKTPELETRIQIRDSKNMLSEIVIPPENGFISMLNHFAQACYIPAIRNLNWKRIEDQSKLMQKLWKED